MFNSQVQKDTMKTYFVRNDISGRYWQASPSEALLYAIGGILDKNYSVFDSKGAPVCLTIYDILVV